MVIFCLQRITVIAVLFKKLPVYCLTPKQLWFSIVSFHGLWKVTNQSKICQYFIVAATITP